MKDVRVILSDIRSTHNVGSAFRTSDAAGISHLYLCGYTPAPVDRFDRERTDIAKVALGAEKTLPWTYVKSTVSLISKLKKEGFTIIAVEQSDLAIDYKKVKLPKKSVIIFGNEVEGVSKSILQKCDVIAEIPMKGKKESLNVSVSLGISLFRMLGV